MYMIVINTEHNLKLHSGKNVKAILKIAQQWYLSVKFIENEHCQPHRNVLHIFFLILILFSDILMILQEFSLKVLKV